jgi:RNA polymerase sigma-70 factor, ECF subfamily
MLAASLPAATIVDLESETIARARTGDETAFSRLYERHYPRIFAFCLRMRGERSKAEDLTQEVFLRAWRNIGSFRGDARFTTWLHSIAANAAINDRARADEVLLPREEDYVTFFESRDIDLERAIAGLPPRARATLLLAVEGYAYEEIATMTGVTVGTVKSQVHRARTLLLEKLS